MGDKLIVMVAITDEENAEKFSSTQHVRELGQKFDLLYAMREIELSDFDAVGSQGLDLDNLIRNAIANHVGRRRNRDEMREKYGQ